MTIEAVLILLILACAITFFECAVLFGTSALIVESSTEEKYYKTCTGDGQYCYCDGNSDDIDSIASMTMVVD